MFLPPPPAQYSQSYEASRNEQIQRLISGAVGVSRKQTKFVLPAFTPTRTLPDGYTQEQFQNFLLTVVSDLINRGQLP